MSKRQFAYCGSLVVLPAPLRLRHGPVVATLERYDDGDVVASLPALHLCGVRKSEAWALAALGEAVRDFWQEVAPMAKAGLLENVLARQWAAFEALVVVGDEADLPAERSRVEPLVAAAKAYAEACVRSRLAFLAVESAKTVPSHDSALQRSIAASMAESGAQQALLEAARAMLADGGEK